MKKILALISIALMTTGCDDFDPYPVIKADQVKKHEYFVECMKTLPAGPQSTKYNDWDEVVSECGRQSSYMSYYCTANCNYHGNTYPYRKETADDTNK